MFVDKLLGLIRGGVNFLGDMLYQLMQLVAKPLSYVYWFFDGIFYFVLQLATVVYKIISLFVALLQFFGALVAGFVRSIAGMLSINFDETPVHYPSTTMQGISQVVELLQPTGMLTVVPLICIALAWFYFVKKIIGLLGGEIKADA